jgi:hypothetical protein
LRRLPNDVAPFPQLLKLVERNDVGLSLRVHPWSSLTQSA